MIEGFSPSWASQVALVVNNLPANAGDIKGAGSIPRSGRSPGGEHGNPLPIFLPGASPGQRSLEGYSSALQRVGHTCSDLARTHTYLCGEPGSDTQ